MSDVSSPIVSPALAASRSSFSATHRRPRGSVWRRLTRAAHAAWVRRAAARRRRRAAACAALFGLMCGVCLAWLPAQALDVNLASATQLQTLRGVGPKMAERVIRERERAGPYASLEDLSDRVRGIGAKRLASFQAAGLTASTSAATQPGARAAGPARAVAPRRPGAPPRGR